jgi:hypothetical protein
MGSEQRDSAAPLAGISVMVQRGDVETHGLPDQSFLLFDRRSRTTIPVSESAARIWKLCDGNHTIDQIVDDLVVIYEAERLQIDHDAREFLALLERHGFVERHSSFQ